MKCISLLLVLALAGAANSIPAEQAGRLVRQSALGHAWREIQTTPARMNEEQACRFAEACLVVGEPTTALQLYRQLERKSPGSRYQFCCAIAAEKSGQSQLSRVYMLQAARGQDSDGDVERSLALERVGKKVTPNPELAQYRALVLSTICLEPAAAVREYKIAMEANPQDKELPSYCGYAEILAGQYAESVRHYEASSLHFPTNYAWALYLNGQLDAAAKICAQESKNPQSSRHTLARLALDRNQPEKALQYLNQILKTQWHNPFYYDERAEILTRLHRDSEAQADKTRAGRLRHLPKPLPALK